MSFRVSCRRFTPVMWLLVLIGLAACSHQTTIAPPQIHYGENVCAFCRMTIDDPRFAAAMIYRTPDGRRKVAIFDDIGCMLAWRRKHPADRAIAAFVHDFKTRQWIKAARAWYVRGAEIQTPMASGIAAGSSRADARQAAPGARLKTMDFKELWSTEQRGHIKGK